MGGGVSGGEVSVACPERSCMPTDLYDKLQRLVLTSQLRLALG